MRSIGHIKNKEKAALFSDLLYANQIETQVQEDLPYGYEIWIINDDDLQRAFQLLNEFNQVPDMKDFKKYQGTSNRVIRDQMREHANAKKQYVDVRTKWSSKGFLAGIGPITKVYMFLSIALFVVIQFGDANQILKYLFINDVFLYGRSTSPQSILQGELWRLITPMFLHFGFIHIIFNMMALHSLGRIVEAKLGFKSYLLLTMIISVLCNLGQFYISGPTFGGMSGVLYGLFGFLWIRGKYDRSFGIKLSTQSIQMMIFFFIACLVGLIPNIANTAHTVGLVSGGLWGYISSKPFRN